MPGTIPSTVRIERASVGTGSPWALGRPATKQPVGVWQPAICYERVMSCVMICGHMVRQPGYPCAGIAFPLPASLIAAKTPTAQQGMALARSLRCPAPSRHRYASSAPASALAVRGHLGRPATKPPMRPASLPLPASREGQSALSAPPFRDVSHNTCQHQANFAICGGSVFYRRFSHR